MRIRHLVVFLSPAPSAAESQIHFRISQPCRRPLPRAPHPLPLHPLPPPSLRRSLSGRSATSPSPVASTRRPRRASRCRSSGRRTTTSARVRLPPSSPHHLHRLFSSRLLSLFRLSIPETASVFRMYRYWSVIDTHACVCNSAIHHHDTKQTATTTR
jgi:hypothetical protein